MGGDPLPQLTHAERRRYARQVVLPQLGEDGQRRLKAATVLLVGAGGLGSPVALYLVAAGVGRLILVDHDRVDESNLQRQVLHGTAALGAPKVLSAVERLRDLNPGVRVEAVPERLHRGNALDLVAAADVVVDGSDNFPTRYLLNDACVLRGRPLVYGSIFRFDGQISVFHADGGPCYRCLFAEPPPPDQVPSCAEGGVLGALPGVIGSLQALETIKLITRAGDPLVGRLLVVDALALTFRELRLRRDPACPACGDHPTITALGDYEAFCGLSPEADAVADAEVTPRQLAALRAAGHAPYLLDVREPWEYALGHLAGAALVPLGALEQRIAEVPRDRDVVTICHHGVRSLTARALLRRHGLHRVRSLAGGMDAWAVEVDPAVGRY